MRSGVMGTHPCDRGNRHFKSEANALPRNLIARLEMVPGNCYEPGSTVKTSAANVRSFLLQLILSLGWAFGPPQAKALIPLGEMSQYSTRAWQTDEGLPQSSVLAVRQTRAGYLWAGTRE